jgi:hypothetical protein
VGTNQIHDFNRGISPEGVFWTIPIKDGVDVDFEDGEAELEVSNLDVDDYFTVVNALLDQSGQPGNHTPVEIPARVSFEINWHRVRDRFRVENAAQRYEASVVLNESTIRWTAQEAAAEGAPSFSYRSTSSTNVFSMLAREKNGRFFKS